MVHVAFAGLGEVAKAIIPAIQNVGHHEITILSRRDPAPTEIYQGINWVKVDYTNKQQLAQILRGVHTVLSFILAHQDYKNTSQKNLIDACIEAGVKRFAPSEWAYYNIEYYPFYNGKAEIRDYLQKINSEKKALEYTLFLPGLFMNYLGPKHKMNKHLSYSETLFDFKNRRAIVPNVPDACFTWTTVEDLGRLVARALDFDGEWPKKGGVAGNRLSLNEMLQLGARIRGQEFAVDRVEIEDLKAGKLTSSWYPALDHPALPPSELEALSRQFPIGSLLSISEGGWEMSDEWNRALPDFEFTTIESFLQESWGGEP